MSKRTHSRPNGCMVSSAQAREWLRQDLPQEVKMQLLLAVKGGRQQKRRCLACGAVGVYVEVYVPNAIMRPMSEGSEGIRLYWTCPGCHAQGLTPELEARLKG
jgi:hypothetical protein